MNKSRTILGMLSLAGMLASTALANPPAPLHRSNSASLVQVNTGRGRLVTLAQPMSDLFVADEAIADVQVRSPTQLYIFGKKTGETTVSATTKGGQVIYAATVRVGQNIDSVGAMLALAMPDAHIVATPMNGLVLLTGTVGAPEDAAEAERLTQAYVGKDTQVLSRLRTATPLQVNLQVRIAEVQRSFVKNIGVNLQSTDPTGGFQAGIAQGRAPSTQFCPGQPLATGFTSIVGGPKDANGNALTCAGSLLNQVANGTTLGAAGKVLGLNLIGALDLGETLGQVSTLANPNLTALSGETATFLVGGEIPIPISQGLGAVSVEYKQYGVSLAFTPTVLSDGRISLRVRPEVSQLTTTGSVQLNGTTIPALTTRRVETTAELGSGQSMVIGGLLQNDQNNQINQTPGLGNIPVLGALFRSNGWQRRETELVVVITPYLVRPVNNQGDIALPTDGYRAPTDLGRVFLGKLSSGVSGEKRPVPVMAPPSGLPPAAVGAVAQVAPAPRPDERREGKATKPQTPGDGAAPAPGFSN